jgi:hypothetical protein
MVDEGALAGLLGGYEFSSSTAEFGNCEVLEYQQQIW